MLDQEDIRKISSFISHLNNSEESHIGYLGNDTKEIENYILEDVSDVKYPDSFVGAYEGNQLIGVLGFDADLEGGNAEILGPFIYANKWNIVLDMWKKLIDLLPVEINSLEMFPNVKNVSVCELAENLNFKKYSDETILIFQRHNSRELIDPFLEELTPKHYLEMKQLHDNAFPGAYYSGQQIIQRLNDHRKVFVITRKNIVVGYIYVEAAPDFGEASIEFFAVESSERGKGTGRQLLTGALKWIFSFENIDSITLCVNSANHSAINLYSKVGFQHLHDLRAYTKKI